MPKLAEGLRIYAIGDVHGRADLLERLFALIDDDLERRPPIRAIQIMLGDYIDRGPASREVIDLILARAEQHEVVALKGNHDAFVPQALADPAAMGDWLMMDGVETLASYGLTSANIARSRLSDLARAFATALPESHLEFFRGLSRVRPGIDLSLQAEDDLIWIRQEFLRYSGDFGKVIVHGHSPVRDVEFHPNRIAVDTAAYTSGKLTALVIEDSSLRVIDTAKADAHAA